MPFIRIVRGHEYRDDPCAALHGLAVQNYGPESALPVSLLRNWYEKNGAIFRIAVTLENRVAGYLSSLPLSANRFEETLAPDFLETSITADDIETSLCPAGGGVFISSIVVALQYQKRSPASLLLRLALLEDLITDCMDENQTVRISSQALSPKGEACMRSLGMKAGGLTTSGWKTYYGQLGRDDLLDLRTELQQKLASRF